MCIMAKSEMRYTVKILLYEIEPIIWRTLSVPGSLTFAKFHEALQKAMGWENKELHEFRYGKGKNLIDVIAMPHDDIIIGGKFDDERVITLNKFFAKKRLPTRMLYRYDFTEDWVHELTIESKKEDDSQEIILIDGARACPPEDCGGCYGYKDALEGDIEWMDDNYDPEVFDPEKVKF